MGATYLHVPVFAIFVMEFANVFILCGLIYFMILTFNLLTENVHDTPRVKQFRTLGKRLIHPFSIYVPVYFVFTALQLRSNASAVLATAIPSVCLSVCPSVRPSVTRWYPCLLYTSPSPRD